MIPEDEIHSQGESNLSQSFAQRMRMILPNVPTHQLYNLPNAPTRRNRNTDPTEQVFQGIGLGGKRKNKNNTIRRKNKNRTNKRKNRRNKRRTSRN